MRRVSTGSVRRHGQKATGQGRVRWRGGHRGREDCKGDLCARTGTDLSSTGTRVHVGQQQGQGGCGNLGPYHIQTLVRLEEKLALNLQMLFQRGDDTRSELGCGKRNLSASGCWCESEKLETEDPFRSC